ncbi:hypothetical protein, partial [Enterococcus faecalis]|uniref:hypothetical protein n=1 Tax=Enterococcus faecalis TaxID=1351 RepID=UPI0032E92B6C
RFHTLSIKEKTVDVIPFLGTLSTVWLSINYRQFFYYHVFKNSSFQLKSLRAKKVLLFHAKS